VTVRVPVCALVSALVPSNVGVWEQTDGPEGSSVEIIEGIVTVSPAPADRYNSIAWEIQRRLTAAVPEDWGIYQTLGVAVPRAAVCSFPTWRWSRKPR
jgi:hypothetical protein